MMWKVELQVKDYVREWSNQIVDTGFKNTTAHIEISGKTCKMCIEGEESEGLFYLLWELLSLYDGYFYKPVSVVIDGKQTDASELKKVSFYSTDVKWHNSELLGRAQRDLSPNVITEYTKFRNFGIKDHSINKSLVNAFYYLHSETYGGINSNHILSLLLNAADGFCFCKYGNSTDLKAKYGKLLKKTINEDLVRHGIDLMGISPEQYKYNLAEERNIHRYGYKVLSCDGIYGEFLKRQLWIAQIIQHECDHLAGTVI